MLRLPGRKMRWIFERLLRQFIEREFCRKIFSNYSWKFSIEFSSQFYEKKSPQFSSLFLESMLQMFILPLMIPDDSPISKSGWRTLRSACGINDDNEESINCRLFVAWFIIFRPCLIGNPTPPFLFIMTQSSLIARKPFSSIFSLNNNRAHHKLLQTIISLIYTLPSSSDEINWHFVSSNNRK